MSKQQEEDDKGGLMLTIYIGVVMVGIWIGALVMGGHIWG